jgi:hypothetical protein
MMRSLSVVCAGSAVPGSCRGRTLSGRSVSLFFLPIREFFDLLLIQIKPALSRRRFNVWFLDNVSLMRRKPLLTRSVNRWLGLVVFLLPCVGAPAGVWAASPTPISACPYSITAPGNYVVTRDLTATGTCISFISPVSNVTLDLQGHSIRGDTHSLTWYDNFPVPPYISKI